MKKALLTLLAATLSMTAIANDYDLNKPFGFCTVSSRTDASSTYNITGGGIYDYAQLGTFTGSYTVLKSNGQDMKATIQNAIKQYDVIIFDGSEGDFIVSENISFERGNKTLLGINNARLCTKWFMTDEIKTALNAAGVPSMSTSGGGGTLPNGTKVSEEAEYNTRKIIIELTGDNSEKYRKSGIFSLNKENVIIRNLTFIGPGSVDVGGYDLISATGAKHCWIDHCAFLDGMDGNFDITNSSDFNTVSWCTFSYTDRSYMHQNTNLVGSSDSEPTGYLNTTFAFNWWGTGCNQRMPMARVGKIHMLNNYYTCVGSAHGINPRKNSEFLIEGNYFAQGVTRYYGQNDATAVTWSDTNHAEETNSRGVPTSFGSTVTVPYEYTVAPYADVPTAVTENAGATLQFKDDSPEELVEKMIYSTDFTDWTKASAAQSASTVTQETKYSHETLTFTLFDTEVNPAGSNSKFKDGATLGWLMAAKSDDPYVTTSKLASITKVRFVHAATGSNRGWKLEAKGDGDADWVTISNSVANPAGWCEVNANVNRTNVQLRFTNLTSNQNAYLFELDIYGNVNIGGTPTLGSIKANGQTYDPSDIFEENASGDMEATIEISKSATMISESNPIEAVAENGTIGTITYVTTATSCKVTIPVTANSKTLNYIINFVQKPDVTLTYIDTDGQTVIGTQQVEKDAQIGEFAYDGSSVTVATGYAFRGWATANSGSTAVKYTTSSTITQNTNLYAYTTPIEVATPTARFDYDLRLETFDPADHEVLTFEGSGYWHDKQHGWVFQNGDKIKLELAGKGYIKLSLCQYSSDGELKLYAPDGTTLVGTTANKVSADGANATIQYDGAQGAGILTLEIPAVCYIHSISIRNLAEDPYTPVEGSNIYIVKRGTTGVESGKNLLSMLELANGFSGTDRKIIFLPDGLYDLEETVLTTISRNNISLIGQSMDGVIIRNAPDISVEGIGTTATLLNTSTGLYMQDLTLQNALDYYGAQRAGLAGGRAVCLQDKGRRTICKNVRMLSYQDTYYSNANNQFYWEDSEIHGTVDYLCGSGDVYYNGCTFVNESRSAEGKTGSDVITAPYTDASNKFGYVFNNCTIENKAESFSLGRAWGGNASSVWLNTTMIQPSEIINTRFTLAGMNVAAYKFKEYHSIDKDGNVVSPASLVETFTKDSQSYTYDIILTDEEAAEYTLDKVFTNWAPDEIAKQADAPASVKLDGTTLTWEDNQTAAAWAVLKNGNVIAFVTTASFIVDDASAVYAVRAANGMGGLGVAVVAGDPTSIRSIEDKKADDGAYYNLQGQRINAPAKGLYIHNGKKVVIK